MKHIIKLVYSLAVIAFVSFAVSAQTFNATVVGKVSDVNGATVAGAEVTVSQNGTSRSQTTMTNADGEFTVPQLPPGEYKIKITAANFKTAQSGDITLLTDTTSRVDLTLEAGNIAEVVTVNAEPAVINTETTEKGEVIVQRQVQELPLNGRDFTDLAKLVPGIYQRPADDDQGQGLAAAGTRTDSTNFSLDGVANRSDRNGAVGVNTSVDSIQEFKVSTSTYSAELGKLAGAQISVVSKGGSNRYGGSVFEFLRNDYFDATNALAAPDDNKILKRHQFGGTFSGPLPFLNFGEGVPVFDSGKDKTFFFASFEQTREVRSIFTSTVAPNAAWAQGDFRIQNVTPTQPFQEVRCISRNNLTGAATRVVCPTPNVIPQNDITTGNTTILGINPIARAILGYLPVANVPGTLEGYKTSIISTILPRNLFSVKFDRKVSDNNNFYFRIASDGRDQYTPQLGRASYPGFARNLEYQNISYAFGDTHSFTPTVVNDFRIGYLSQNNKTINENNDIDYIGLFGITGLPTGQTPGLLGFPAIRIDGYPDTGDSANTPFNYQFKNLSIYDSLTWIVGNHNLKFGIDLTRPNYIESDIRNVRGDFRFRGRFTNPANQVGTGLRSFADFLYGLPDSTQRQLGSDPANLSAWQSAFFIQDNWKATSWLTLNLGVRYDYTPYLSEKTNRMSNFIPELGISVCAGGEIRDPTLGLICRDAASLGLPKSLVKTDTNNIAPRFGFAITPFNDNKTVIRGGAGIFYSTETINPARQQLANNYPYLFREQYSRSSTANLLQITLANPFPSDRAALQGFSTPQGIPTDSQTPEVYQFNLTLERELTSDLGLEIGYVGSQGRFLGMRYNLNAAQPTGVGTPTTNPQTGVVTYPLILGPRPYPTLGDITYQIQGVNSSYNAMQVAIRRRAKNGLTLLASYTFGKAMDQNSNTNNSTTGSQRSPQDPRDFRADWALADYHRTHQFSGSFNYDLPFGRGQKFFGNSRGLAQALFGGWQMNGIVSLLSGRPFTPVYATADTTGGRPDLVGDPKAKIPEGLFFNPRAFARPRATPGDPNLYGNSGRNIVIGPDFKSVDLSLFKNIKLREKMKLQLRWEVFNVLNHPNFQIPQQLLESSDEGRFRFTSNEAREMQFAAKIIF